MTNWRSKTLKRSEIDELKNYETFSKKEITILRERKVNPEEIEKLKTMLLISLLSPRPIKFETPTISPHTEEH